MKRAREESSCKIGRRRGGTATGNRVDRKEIGMIEKPLEGRDETASVRAMR